MTSHVVPRPVTILIGQVTDRHQSPLSQNLVGQFDLELLDNSYYSLKIQMNN